MLQRFFIFWFAFIGFASADPKIEVLGQFQKLDPGLAHGIAAIPLLKNIRLDGNYGAQNAAYPSIHAFRKITTLNNETNNNQSIIQSMYQKDWPQGWVEAFLQYLFPSSGLVGLVEGTKDSEAAYELWHDKAAIGRVLAVLKNNLVNQNETLLIGAIMAAFNPILINEKALKKAKKTISMQNKEIKDPYLYICDQQGKKAIASNTSGSNKINKKLYNPEKYETLAVVTAKAYLNSKDHPPHIVEQAFWALAWKTSSTAEEIEQVYLGFLGEQKLEIGSLYDKEQNYIPFKGKLSQSNVPQEQINLSAKLLAQNPFLSTYIGIGYNYYDAPLPPNLTYGIARYNGIEFPDCGEDSLWNVFNILLWNEESKRFDTTVLEKIASSLEIDVNLSEKEIEGKILPQEWHPLKRLVWFYKHFPEPVQSQEARDLWAAVVSNLGSPTLYIKNNCEIKPGIDNMQAIISLLIPDPKLKKGTEAERFTRLCEIFSTENKKWAWKNKDGKEYIGKNTDITIEFYNGNRKVFNWEFLSGHFEVRTLIGYSKWQNKLGSALLKLLPQQPTFPQLTFYTDLLNNRVISNQTAPDALFWTLAYGSLYSEQIKKAVITKLIKEKVRDQYGLVENLMKRMPIQDLRIQEFVVDRLLFDGEYIENSNHQWMKEELKKWRNKASDTNIANIMENEFPNLVMFLAANGANVNKKDKNGKTALVLAAAQGYLDVVKFLVEKGAHELNAALTEAAFHNHLDIAQFLLENNGATNINMTLNKFASMGMMDVVKLLVANGADDLNTALENALKYKFRNVAEFLIESGATNLNIAFKTPYDYFSWAEKILENSLNKTVIIGILNTLMGKSFGINEKVIAKGKIALDILKAIATVAKLTKDNALTDQVWLTLKHKNVSTKIQKHRIAVYILENYARNKMNKEKTREEILSTNSPIFKDIDATTRGQYVDAAIKNYGLYMIKVLEK